MYTDLQDSKRHIITSTSAYVIQNPYALNPVNVIHLKTSCILNRCSDAKYNSSIVEEIEVQL